MALKKSEISSNLEKFLLSLQEEDKITDKDKERIKKYADGLSDWLITSVKSATVTVEPGISVSTIGSATAQTGETTAPGSGSIK